MKYSKLEFFRVRNYVDQQQTEKERQNNATSKGQHNRKSKAVNRALRRSAKPKNRKTKFLIATATAFTFLITLFMSLAEITAISCVAGWLLASDEKRVRNARHPFLKREFL